MKQVKAKDILLPTLALFVICLIATVLLALTNEATAAKIEENAAQTAIASRAEVLSEANGVAVASYGDDKTDESSGLTYNEGLDADGNVVGYIFTAAAKGYGGDVKVMDTPGFSLLENEVFDPVELKESYPEFGRYEGQCYFQPCYHATEPRCAVRDAVAAGEMDEQRHGRYVALLEEMKQRWRDRYD